MLRGASKPIAAGRGWRAHGDSAVEALSTLAKVGDFAGPLQLARHGISVRKIPAPAKRRLRAPERHAQAVVLPMFGQRV